jgi:hypothetical protein
VTSELRARRLVQERKDGVPQVLAEARVPAETGHNVDDAHQ